MGSFFPWLVTISTCKDDWNQRAEARAPHFSFLTLCSVGSSLFFPPSRRQSNLNLIFTHNFGDFQKGLGVHFSCCRPLDFLCFYYYLRSRFLSLSPPFEVLALWSSPTSGSVSSVTTRKMLRGALLWALAANSFVFASFQGEKR